MTANTPPQPLDFEKTAQLTIILRMIGAIFILGGLIVGLDVAGLATKAGLNDGTDDSMHHLFGGLIVLVGLVDIFILPAFFKRLQEGRNTSQ